jgi:toluene monooxygenase electron transfer component
MKQITIAGGSAFPCEDDDTILRAALRAGLAFPYECNVGSCGNCRFELIEGEVEHERKDSPAYTERDIQRKRWLGCQAKPHSDCNIKVRLIDHYKPQILPQRVLGTFTGQHDITHDIREFRFKLDTPVMFLPGQYALLHVPGIQGGRAYSMSNVTNDRTEWDFQIRRVPNGKCTSALFDRLNAGDKIGIDGPYGMAYLREEAERDILCLGGGSGLAPVISIARGWARSDKLKGRKLHLIYGGRTVGDICGEDMLKELRGFGVDLHYYPVVSMPDAITPGEWTGLTGFVHDVAAQTFGDNLKDMEIYFAGPPMMAEAVMRLVVEKKIPTTQVHYDQFV